MDYYKIIELVQIEPGIYASAILEIEDYAGIHRRYTEDNRRINEWLRAFAKQEHTTVENLLKDTRKVKIYYTQLRTPSKTSPIQYLKEDKMFNDYNKKHHIRPYSWKEKIIKLIIGGLIIVIVTTGFYFGARYVVKRKNAYNNKRIEFAKDDQQTLSSDLINVLGSDKFNETVDHLAQNDYSVISNYKMNDIEHFEQQFDVVLDANDTALRQFNTGRGILKVPFYQLDYQKCFPVGSNEYEVIKKFEGKYNELAEDMAKMDYNGYLSDLEYLAKISVASLYCNNNFYKDGKADGELNAMRDSRLHSLQPLGKRYVLKIIDEALHLYTSNNYLTKYGKHNDSFGNISFAEIEQMIQNILDNTSNDFAFQRNAYNSGHK